MMERERERGLFFQWSYLLFFPRLLLTSNYPSLEGFNSLRLRGKDINVKKVMNGLNIGLVSTCPEDCLFFL